MPHFLSKQQRPHFLLQQQTSPWLWRTASARAVCQASPHQTLSLCPTCWMLRTCTRGVCCCSAAGASVLCSPDHLRRLMPRQVHSLSGDKAGLACHNQDSDCLRPQRDLSKGPPEGRLLCTARPPRRRPLPNFVAGLGPAIKPIYDHMTMYAAGSSRSPLAMCSAKHNIHTHTAEEPRPHTR